jgi:8-oxo-dGTP diphosphatase
MKTYFVVTGVVTYNGKMLILKKSADDYNYPYHWSFCSGFVKEFESGEDTVIREIKEETGLDAEIIKKAGVTFSEDKDKGKGWIVIAYLCKAQSDKVTLDHENSDYAWVTKDEISNYQLVPNLVKNMKSIGIL